MILHCDNKGTVDLVNNWSVSGRTRHVDVKKFWLRDLKEDKIVLVIWIPSDEMFATIDSVTTIIIIVVIIITMIIGPTPMFHRQRWVERNSLENE